MRDENTDEIIETSNFITKYSIPINGLQTPLEIRKNRFKLIAINPTILGEILGFVNFVYQHDVHSLPIECLYFHMENVKELGFLQVDPEYFGFGIGSLLLEQTKKIVNSTGNRILVRPQRPDGEGLTLEQKDYYFPFSDEQLRRYYLKRGFREFTEDEVSGYTKKLDLYVPPPSLDVEYPPYPEPVFNDTLEDRLLKIFYGIPILGDIVCEGVDKRRPLDEWRKQFREAWDVAFKNRYRKSQNYEYVKKHLIQEV